MPTLVQLAQEMRDNLLHEKEQYYRGHYSYRDSGRDELHSMICRIEDDYGQQDTIDVIAEALDMIVDNDGDREVLYDIEADIFTHELMAWLARGHDDAMDAYVSTYGWPHSDTSFAGLVQRANADWKEHIALSLYDALDQMSDDDYGADGGADGEDQAFPDAPTILHLQLWTDNQDAHPSYILWDVSLLNGVIVETEPDRGSAHGKGHTIGVNVQNQRGDYLCEDTFYDLTGDDWRALENNGLLDALYHAIFSNSASAYEAVLEQARRMAQDNRGLPAD